MRECICACVCMSISSWRRGRTGDYLWNAFGRKARLANAASSGLLSCEEAEKLPACVEARLDDGNARPSHTVCWQFRQRIHVSVIETCLEGASKGGPWRLRGDV